MRGPRAIGLVLASIAGLNLAAAIASRAAHVPAPGPAERQQSRGARLFQDKGCVACHSLHGQGGRVGPALDGVAQRVTRDELMRRLADPASVNPRTAMPRIPLRDDDKAALVHFLLEENRQ